jgi:hypothetical protein
VARHARRPGPRTRPLAPGAPVSHLNCHACHLSRLPRLILRARSVTLPRRCSTRAHLYRPCCSICHVYPPLVPRQGTHRAMLRCSELKALPTPTVGNRPHITDDHYRRRRVACLLATSETNYHTTDTHALPLTPCHRRTATRTLSSAHPHPHPRAHCHPNIATRTLTPQHGIDRTPIHDSPQSVATHTS